MGVETLIKWEKFKNLKKRQEVINEKMKYIDRDEYIKLLYCGYYVNLMKCINCGTRHFAGFFRCKSRFCLVCSRIRTMKYLKKVLEKTNMDENNYFHLVLTLENMDDLNNMVNIMNQYWRQFYNGNKEFRKWWKLRYSGGIRSMEVKRGKDLKWHVHFHILLISNKDYKRDFDCIMKRWKEVTKGKGSVFIKQARNYKVLIEVVKYITNIEKIGIDDMSEVYFAIKGKRVINTFGILRGIDENIEKEMENDIEEDLNFICRKCGFKEYEIENILYSDLLEEKIYDL